MLIWNKHTIIAKGSVIGYGEDGFKWHNHDLKFGYALIGLTWIDNSIKVKIPWKEPYTEGRGLMHEFRESDFIAWPYTWLQIDE